MRRAKLVLLTALSAVFTAVGLIVVVVDPDERLTGAVVSLFFGSCVLVFLAQLIHRPRRGSRQAVVAHRGVRSHALVYPMAGSKLRVYGIAGALWAVVGVLMFVFPETLADPDESTLFLRLLGAALVVMFGGVALVALLRERRGGSGYVALLPDGILARGVGGGSFVPWNVIESVDVVAIHDTPMVALRVTDPGAIEVPRWAGLFSRANRAIMGADVAYANLEASEEELAEAIRARLKLPGLDSNQQPSGAKTVGRQN